MGDYRCSYLLLCLLECIGFVGESDECSLIVRRHMIAQLLSHQLFHWACFVACQIEAHDVRTNTVKSIIIQWCNHANNYDESNHLGSYSELDIAFLTKELKLPRSWIHEAQAYACTSKYSRAIELINAFKTGQNYRALDKSQPARQRIDLKTAAIYARLVYERAESLRKEAYKLVCTDIAPRALFMTSKAKHDLFTLLKIMKETAKFNLSRLFNGAGDEGELGLRDEGEEVIMYTDNNEIFEKFLEISETDFAELAQSGDREQLLDDFNAVLEESQALLSRLSAHFEERTRRSSTGSVAAQQVSLVDMGSTLHRRVRKLLQFQDLGIQGEVDDHTGVDDRVLHHLMSLPSNCIDEKDRIDKFKQCSLYTIRKHAARLS